MTARPLSLARRWLFSPLTACLSLFKLLVSLRTPVMLDWGSA